MKKRAYLMIGLGMIALAACAPASATNAVVASDEASPDPSRPANGVAKVADIEGYHVYRFCDQGRAVYAITGSGSSMQVVEDAAECGAAHVDPLQ